MVINADSMQVYRDLRIITARPTPEEEAEAPHRLYGHVDAAVNFSVGRYVADAIRVLQDIQGRKLPIFVGGTGLYFKALTEGLSDMPPVPDEVREQVRRESEGLETPELHRLLSERDPETARTLRPSDRLRVQRALEIFAATGQAARVLPRRQAAGAFCRRAGHQALPRPGAGRASPAHRRPLPRDDGQRRPRRGEGAGRAQPRPMLPAMRAHGVPGLLAHLRGEIPLDEAIARGQGDTRRYAKRQFTWFRHQLPDWQWVGPEQGLRGRDGADQCPGAPVNIW